MNKRIKYDKYDSGNAFFLSIVAPQVLGIVLVLAIMIIGSIANVKYEDAIANPIVLALVALSAQFCFVVVFFVYNHKTKTNWIKATGLNQKPYWLNILVCVAISAICIFGFNGIVGLFDKLVNLVGYETTTSWPLPINNGWWFVVNLIGLAILPAIFEELLFRGIILNGLKQYGKWAAVLGSAGLFALLHGNIGQLIYPFMLGVILGYIVYKTGNVLYSIIIHLINNTFSIIYTYIDVMKNNGQYIVEEVSYSVGDVFMHIGIAIASATLVFTLVKFVLKATKNEQGEHTESEKQTLTLDDIPLDAQQQIETKKFALPNKFLTLGIIIGIVLWILDLISNIAGL